ncbi:MAG: hypothetical protein OXH20_03385 [bacterium]|nr:hypothetical protein [bacterium]MDE0668398.1 hypothetical protein [bacterium]MYB25428.1 hypothetical protein [Acidimicrobiia bacterium]
MLGVAGQTDDGDIGNDRVEGEWLTDAHDPRGRGAGAEGEDLQDPQDSGDAHEPFDGEDSPDGAHRLSLQRELVIAHGPPDGEASEDGERPEEAHDPSGRAACGDADADAAPRPMAQAPVLAFADADLIASSKAWQHYRETGDESDLVRLGILPSDMKPNW